MTTSPRRDSAISTQRRDVEDLVRSLPRGDLRQLSFEEPWQIRAFALAVGAHQAGRYEWRQFQRALVESIGGWEDSVDDVDDASWCYYEHWVHALEAVLEDLDLLDPRALTDTAQAVLAAPSNRNHHAAHRDPIAVDPATHPDSWRQHQ